MPKRVRVISNRDEPRPTRTIVARDTNPAVPRLTENEKRARRADRIATTTSMGSSAMRMAAMGAYGIRTADTIDSQTAQFYSPQLSTDFLEKPQNIRERRAFYRFFYNTNEIVGQAIDIHSTLPLSKLRLVPPKGKNKHQNEYVYKFFVDMCDRIKLFKTLIEISHDFYLLGNCLAPWAQVRTIRGYKKAEDINIGDFVLTHKNRYRKITKVCRRPADEIFKIKCWKDYRELPLTGEHPVEIFKNGKFEFIKVEDLTLNDYIRITWPDEVEHISEISLSFPNDYKKVVGGYEHKVIISHPRDLIAVEIRKKLLNWLTSLTEPVIKTRAEIARDFNVSLMSLDNVVFILGKELEFEFHQRIGAKGWQKGSQTIWFPIDLNSISFSDQYAITRTDFLPSVDKINIDNDFAYLAGFWLGDGTLARDSSRDNWGRGLWQICAKETCTENIDRIRKILINIFGKDSITEWVSEGMKYLRVISNPAFIEWWADNFGETTFGNNYKKIPDWFEKLPREKLLNFLAGIIDSDGCASVSGQQKDAIIKISMASKPIMDSIRDICLKCDVDISYMITPERDCTLPNGTRGRTSVMYSVSTLDEESCYALVEYANKNIPTDAHFASYSRWRIRTDEGIALKVKFIKTEPYEGFVHNFEVEEDHTYQVEGFSTHNCFIFAEEQDWEEDIEPEEAARKKQEALQRSQYLKQKFDIVDKNPLFKGWNKLLILPPDQVRVRKLPLSDDVAIEYMPDPETRKFLTSDIQIDPSNPTKEVKNTISNELKEKIRQSGVIPLDTDPNTGSHVYHLARKKSQYEPLGVSIIERCINTLILLDKLRQAQTSIASRHMTPMRVIWSEGLNSTDVDNLREQVDMALVDPDFSIIANYEIHWEEMGSQGRLLDLSAEDENGLNRLFAGLGVTREILTGEGTYTGSKISLEIMNTQYLLFREVIQEYVENYLFKPIARKKGFIEYDDYGNEVLLYPRLSFTRLAIRDNEQFFDAVFQLYQKGSVSIDLILDILNIDPDSTKEKIEKDLFTVNDSVFNEVMRNIYTNVAAPLVEKTDLVAKLAEYLNLRVTEEKASADGASRFSSTKEAREEKTEKKELSDKQIKLMKVMKYLQANPEILDRVVMSKGVANG
jgi:intein/homing endonuclease